MKTAAQAELQSIHHASVLTGPARFRTELSILFRIQFAIVRDSWVWIVLMATMFPLTTLLFMRFFVENPTRETMIQMIAGNMIFGLLVMGLNAMAQEISWQKHDGHFTFYASLPISKLNFVIAILLRGLMSTLPSFALLSIIGQWMYDIQFHFSWALPLVAILSLASVVGIGVCMGFWSPNHQLTNMLAQALMMLITFLSPVMVQLDQLPLPVQWISYLLPTTYAAEALRGALLTGWTHDVMVNCIVLLGFAIVSITATLKLVQWRITR
ncbi:ABC-2 type transport system permease protein [Paenibacillus taihuensis]|uniref:Transport permease protein n=1 Tax=Paenibacillus taihuensis TaxID=1156355 RepID=A0A3D9SG08_9BACL|nr:ABC transporter permease [Paenibacillus taihuensis]REE94607.1 ABC-2 type transport system permease protein [Paenibacillus taihuensis]